MIRTISMQFVSFIAAGANLDSVDNSWLAARYCTGWATKRARFFCLPLVQMCTHAMSCGRTPLHWRGGCRFCASTGHARRAVDCECDARGGADLDVADVNGNTARQLLADHQLTFDDDAHAEAVESARREIAKVRLDFVRHRAWQVCIGLQSRGLDALQMCEILVHACGPVAPLIPFHQWWKIATTVKHFKALVNPRHQSDVGGTLADIVRTACAGSTAVSFKMNAMTWGVTGVDDERLTLCSFGDYNSADRLEAEVPVGRLLERFQRTALQTWRAHVCNCHVCRSAGHWQVAFVGRHGARPDRRCAVR
jgi:hypothetical protein